MSEIETLNPGEIGGWPSLRIVYRTDADKIADILPPGIEPGPEPIVSLHVYQVPINGAPEFGVVTEVPAYFQGELGFYTIGIGIDQEDVIFPSQELNGQPKFPCSTQYYRLGDTVVAKCTHMGYTFLEFKGEVGKQVEVGPREVTKHDWWIKSLRAVGRSEKSYDFPPQVVKVTATSTVDYQFELDGQLVLRDSPWDPYTTQLPMREQVSALLQKNSMDYRSRSLTIAGPLDPIAFWPYADKIGGSRWLNTPR